MSRKVIVTCALTGAGDTTSRSEHVPVSPDQIAADAIAAARAGASVVHIHVRDVATGQGSRDVALYREVVRQVKASDVDPVINLTAGMGGDLFIDPSNPTVHMPGTDLVSRARAPGTRRGIAPRNLHHRLRFAELWRRLAALCQHPRHVARGRRTDPRPGREAGNGNLRHRQPVVCQRHG